MHIKFETKDFLEALSRMTKLISSPHFVTFIVGKDRVILETTLEGVSVQVQMIATIKAEGKISVPFAIMKNLFRNRKEIELRVSKAGNKLEFKIPKAENFGGDIVAIDTPEVHFEKLGDGAIEFDKKQTAFIFDAVKQVGIDEVFFKQTLPMTIHFSKKGAYCFVTSAFHMAAMKSKESFKEVTVTLPFKNFLSILNLSGGRKFNLYVTDSTISAYNEYFQACMPLEDLPESSLDEVLSVIKQFDKAEPCCTVKSGDFKSCVSSLLALHDKTNKTSIKITVGKTLDAEISSRTGNLKEQVPIKAKTAAKPFTSHPSTLTNLLGTMQDEKYRMIVGKRLFGFIREEEKQSVYYIGAFYE